MLQRLNAMITLTTSDIYSEVAQLMETHSSRKHEEAKRIADGIFVYLENSDKEHLLGISCFALGMRFHVKSEFKQALVHFEQGYLNAGNEKDIAAINHFGTALANRSMGNLDEAVNQLFLAVEKINTRGPLKNFLLYVYVQLGEIHVVINEHEIALDFFSKVQQVSNNTWKNMALLYNAIGGCYYSMKQYEKGREFLQKAVNSKEISPTLLSKAQNDLGMLHLELGELNEAETILRESIRIREELKMEDAAGTSMCHLAETYLKQNRVSEAIELLNSCKLISEKYDTKWKGLRILNLLAKAYSLNQDHRTANEYYEQSNILQNKVKGEQEKNILKLKNEQIEKQKKIIQEKHQQLSATLEEIKQLKINRKAMLFSWITVIALVLVSEIFIDPIIENYSYNIAISLLVKTGIALLFKPIDGMYESILWSKTIKKIE
jgi:tetratricopeptide (TPR) repeat protein